MINGSAGIPKKSISDFALAQEKTLIISVKLLQRRMSLLRAIGFAHKIKKCSLARKQQFLQKLKDQFLKISQMQQISQQITRKLNKLQRQLFGIKEQQQKQFCYSSINRTISEIYTDKKTQEIQEILLCDLLEEDGPQIMIEDCPSIQYSVQSFYFDPPKQRQENESQKVCKIEDLQENIFQQENEGNDFY